MRGPACHECVVSVLVEPAETLELAADEHQAVVSLAAVGLLPGIKINTSASDFFPIEQMQLMRFNGESWELFGDIIAGEVSH